MADHTYDKYAKRSNSRPFFHKWQLFLKGGRGGYSPILHTFFVDEHVAVGWPPVAPGPAHFLGVVLEALGHVVVHDAPNVGFVETHTERNSRHHDPQLVSHELELDLLAVLWIGSEILINLTENHLLVTEIVHASSLAESATKTQFSGTALLSKSYFDWSAVVKYFGDCTLAGLWTPSSPAAPPPWAPAHTDCESPAWYAAALMSRDLRYSAT